MRATFEGSLMGCVRLHVTHDMIEKLASRTPWATGPQRLGPRSFTNERRLTLQALALLDVNAFEAQSLRALRHCKAGAALVAAVISCACVRIGGAR